MRKQLLLQQERRDGKIREIPGPDAIDWLFTVIGFLAIEAVPAGGIIASWISGNIAGVIIGIILAIGVTYAVMNARGT